MRCLSYCTIVCNPGRSVLIICPDVRRPRAGPRSRNQFSLRHKKHSPQNTGTDRAKGVMTCKMIAVGRYPMAKSSLWLCFLDCDMPTNPRNAIVAEKEAPAVGSLDLTKPSTCLKIPGTRHLAEKKAPGAAGKTSPSL